MDDFSRSGKSTDDPTPKGANPSKLSIETVCRHCGCNLIDFRLTKGFGSICECVGHSKRAVRFDFTSKKDDVSLTISSDNESLPSTYHTKISGLLKSSGAKFLVDQQTFYDQKESNVFSRLDTQPGKSVSYDTKDQQTPEILSHPQCVSLQAFDPSRRPKVRKQLNMDLSRFIERLELFNKAELDRTDAAERDGEKEQ